MNRSDRPRRAHPAGFGCWMMMGLACLLTGVDLGRPARAQSDPSGVLGEIGFDQRLGETVPTDLIFMESSGREVRLADYLVGKPIILSFVYFECPMLCPMTMGGLVKSLRAISFDLGEEYEVVTVSIAPEETPEQSRPKKDQYVKEYGRRGANRGWHFLTGDEASIRRLTEAVGFRYTKDAETGQYAHASGIAVLTPEGRLTRYLFGIEFSARDLRLALVEASAGKIGTPVDQILLYCYHYDPVTGRYSLTVMSGLRVAGVTTVLALGLFMLRALRRERRRASAASEPS